MTNPQPIENVRIVTQYPDQEIKIERLELHFEEQKESDKSINGLYNYGILNATGATQKYVDGATLAINHS